MPTADNDPNTWFYTGRQARREDAMRPTLRGHLWQAYAALQRNDLDHTREHLKAAITLSPGSGLGLIPLEPCLLTGQSHYTVTIEGSGPGGAHSMGHQPPPEHP